MLFRKKPVVIEAIQFNGRNYGPVFDFMRLPTGGTFHRYDKRLNQITIRTLEGDMNASNGDWIIKGVKGEFYPCKPDIFEATYEPVKETK